MIESFSRVRLGPAYGRLRERLKAARIEAGLTQAEVGHLILKPQSFVSKIEGGDRGVDYLEMQVFACIYGKPLTYFADLELSANGEREK